MHIKDYLIDDTFKMIVEENQIYINHFKKMRILEENHIYFMTRNKNIHLYGNDLKMKRLVNKEILLTGHIHKIEVEDAE